MTSRRLEFRILGPLDVRVDGVAVSVGGPKQRALLALLLLHANQVVSRDRLIDQLVPDRAGKAAADVLNVQVSRLRKSLEAADAAGPRLVARSPGYLLRVEPGELDFDRFEQLVRESRAAREQNDLVSAAELLRAALSLWRGRPLADLEYEPFALTEVERLEELRLGAVEDRFDVELARGRHGELVPELELLVHEHPSRERLLAQLMVSLYRSGRQTDALDAFQAARRRLVEELGLEPGPGLQELQRRILEQDPTLAAPSRFPPIPTSRAGRQRSLALVVALVVLVAGVFLLSAGAGNQKALPAGASGVVAVQTASDRRTVATPLAGFPGSVADGAGSVWVADPGVSAVWRVDAKSGGKADRIPLGGEPGSIVYGDGAVWVASTTSSTVTRIDPATEQVAPSIHLPGANPVAIAYGAHRVWVADSVERELFEIDPASDALKRTWQLDLQPSALTTGDGAVWVAGYNDATVEKLDPASGKVIGRVHVGDGPVALTFAFGSLWVANSLDSTVSRVNPTTLAVRAPIAVGSGPAALLAGRGAVWVANQYSGTVSRIAPRGDRVRASVAVGGTPTSLTLSGGRLWVGVAANPGSHRGGTLVIVTTTKFSTTSNEISSIDPAFYDQANPPQFMGLAYDSLVTFQQTSGAAGLRLVPDLALSIPAASDGGKTYTFRIRPGIRYSDGQPLRPDDFRRAIERLFAVNSPGTSSFKALVGGGICPPIPDHCPAIGTDDRTGTVTFHLSAPDSDFLYGLAQSYAAPIPPGTPDRETGSRTVPGTGPYKIVSISSTKVRFVRNPFFHEWSHAAQPDGNPNSIVWRALPSTHDAVAAVEQGRADWLYFHIQPHAYQQLELQDPAQLHSNPLPVVDFAGFDTQIPPFNDVRVRQALNYAIDRNKIVQLYGGPSLATPTCQPIAPLLPGYKRYCPYTLHPNPNGAYSGPDMARARQLVAESGTRGETINLLGDPDIGVPPATVPLYFASVLRSLGYRVHTYLVPFNRIMQLGVAPQIAVNGDWTPAYPDPSSYIPSFLSCAGGNNWGGYCNPTVDREMQQAQRLDLTNPPKARAVWETIDRQLTNTAAWVPTVTYPEIELTSRRLHNYQYNPVWGFLADQSSIH
jgi:YVTN family beta-propeller protein